MHKNIIQNQKTNGYLDILHIIKFTATSTSSFMSQINFVKHIAIDTLIIVPIAH